MLDPEIDSWLEAAYEDRNGEPGVLEDDEPPLTSDELLALDAEAF